MATFGLISIFSFPKKKPEERAQLIMILLVAFDKYARGTDRASQPQSRRSCNCSDLQHTHLQGFIQSGTAMGGHNWGVLAG